MSGPTASGVFISYRRQESSGIAGRLYDRFAARFGDDQVFMDVDTIAPGVDFRQVIAQAVNNCAVLLAVVGPGWLTVTDENGQRRLDDPDDIVRLEIQTALERDILVIPILVEGAVIPRPQQLPEGLVGLARRNAHSLRHESFRSDADHLLTAVEPILSAQVPPVAVHPAKTAPKVNQVQSMRLDNNVNEMAFSPDGQLLATASADRTARIWEVASGQERTRVTHGKAVRGVAFSPDGQLLATASADRTARIWEVASGQERTRVTHDNAVRRAAFSPDGQLLATASADRTARTWEVASGQERTRFTHSAWEWTTALSPDGRLLATTNGFWTARIWEVASGQERTRVTHGKKVRGAAFSPDGQLLATIGANRKVRIWEVASGREHTRFTYDPGVWHVAFSPDGQLFATSLDRMVRIWEVTSGQERIWLPHLKVVLGLAFSPNGQLLATVSRDQAAIWSIVQ
jgi:WD40 repeat protein